MSGTAPETTIVNLPLGEKVLMKRISTAAVAAATALSLATVPAMAQQAEPDTAATTVTQPSNENTEATGTTDTTESETPKTGTTDTPENTDNKTDEPVNTGTTGGDTKKPANTGTTNTTPSNTGKSGSQSSGSSQGTVVAVLSGTLGAVLTTALIVFADPRGANKIIDLVNREFGLGVPHLNVPKVQLPNLPF